MHPPIPHAALHPLTPGSPAYVLLKVTAVGSLFGLRAILARRARKDEVKEPQAETSREAKKSHPVSKRRTRKRRH